MDQTQRKVCLDLARETIRAHLTRKPLPPPPAIEYDPASFGGAFVTLRKKGRLRGCIGRFSAEASLPQTVQDMALAALKDPRFLAAPVLLSELPEITIEISILAPMQRVQDPLSLEVGRHGLYVRRGHQSGCFLPQVVTEQGWTKEEFLSHCCSGKAGLPADAWRQPDTEVFLFTAEVIEEEN